MSKKNEIAPLHARCTSEDVQQREAAHSTYTHKCKHERDHVGQHRCICERAWTQKAKA